MNKHDYQNLFSTQYINNVKHNAVIISREAGFQALSQADHQGSIELYNHALDTLHDLPVTFVTSAKNIDIHLEMIKAYLIRGDWKLAKILLEKTLKLSNEINNEDRIIQTQLLSMLFSWIKGEYKESILNGKKILKIPSLYFGYKVSAIARIAGMCFDMGHFKKARKLHSGNLKILAKNDCLYESFSLLTLVSTQSYAHLSQMNGFQGSFEQGYNYANQGWKIAVERNHPFSEAYINSRLGSVYIHQGRFAEGLYYLEKNHKFCVFSKNNLFGPYIAMIPYVKAQLGDITDALEEFVQLFNFKRPHNIEKSYFSQIFGWYAETLLLAERYTMALQACNRALANAKTLGERFNQAWLYRLKADILLSSSPTIDSADSAEILDLINKSLYRCRQENLRPSEAHCYMTLGKLHQKMGQYRKAKTFFASAAYFYEKMSMFFYENKAVNLTRELL